MFEIGQCNVVYVKGFFDYEVIEGFFNKNIIEEVILMRKLFKKLVMRILNEIIVLKLFFFFIFYRSIRLVIERIYLIIQSGSVIILCVSNLKCQFFIFFMIFYIILILCLREIGIFEGMLQYNIFMFYLLFDYIYGGNCSVVVIVIRLRYDWL